MSFVGTRPEAVRYVEKYKPEYYANILYFRTAKLISF